MTVFFIISFIICLYIAIKKEAPISLLLILSLILTYWNFVFLILNNPLFYYSGLVSTFVNTLYFLTIFKKQQENEKPFRAAFRSSCLRLYDILPTFRSFKV